MSNLECELETFPSMVWLIFAPSSYSWSLAGASCDGEDAAWENAGRGGKESHAKMELQKVGFICLKQPLTLPNGFFD